MSNVTQKIPNLIKGVSRLPDFDKKLGEVREALNCYPDLSYGMTKRPGTEYIGTLPGLTETEASDSFFFPIIREGKPRYICALRDGTTAAESIKIWNLDTLEEVTVQFPTGQELAWGYLDLVGTSVTNNDAYRVAHDTLRTVIVNRTKIPAEDQTLWQNASEPFTYTIREKNRNLNSIDDLPDGRVVRVQMTGGGGTFPSTFRPLREGIHYLPVTVNQVDNSGNKIETEGSGCVVKVNVDNTGHAVLLGAWRTENGVTTWVDNDANYVYNSATDERRYDAEVWASGSGYPDQCPCEVNGIPGSRINLATGIQVGSVYRIVNSASDADDIYMQPFSNKTELLPGQASHPREKIDGPYFWKECPSPDSYVGLNNETLPHELVWINDTTFEFRRIDYSSRWVGDEITNPAPSFIGSPINNVFFLNNRLAFLSEDNVILSRPIDYGVDEGIDTDTDYVPDGNPWIRRNYGEIDFFKQSSVAVNAADPIDLKSATNDTSVLHKAIATPQGVVLFADGQQSLLYQPEGLLSPLTASINSVSNYDMTDEVMPIIVGETCYFINKGANFCRIYSFVNRGMQNPPVIEDVTKEVSDWLPNTITDMEASSTDNMLLAYSRDSRMVYNRRVVDQETSAWTKWQLPERIVKMVVDHDEVFYLSKANDTVKVHKADMYVIPDDTSYVFSPESQDYEFTGLPSNYDYTTKIRGYRQLTYGNLGTVEVLLPWHNYYFPGTESQYNQWRTFTVNGSPVTASALYSIEVDFTSADQWNIGYKIKYKDANNNNVLTAPAADSEWVYLPYDAIFRLKPNASVPNPWIDGCYKSDNCARLMILSLNGTVTETPLWTNEITDIDTSGSSVVITCKHCEEGYDQTYTTPKASFYDAYIVNANKVACELEPDNYRYVRLVVDYVTPSGFSQTYGASLPATLLRWNNPATGTETADIYSSNASSYFPLYDEWWEKDYTESTHYFSFLSPSIKTYSQLGCGTPFIEDFTKLDNFFCQENPGRLVGVNPGTGNESLYTRYIHYNSNTNYEYLYSSNQGSWYDGNETRSVFLDINDSRNCSYRLQSGDQVGDSRYTGRPWSTHIFVYNSSKTGIGWTPYGVEEYDLSFCSSQSKFNGFNVGGRVTQNGEWPNVSGNNEPGFAYDGYQQLYDGATTATGDTYHTPPGTKSWTYITSDLQTFWPEKYDDSVAQYGIEPPGRIDIRGHYDLANELDSNGYPIKIAEYVSSDEGGFSGCDSCAPLSENIPVSYTDLVIKPYLDFYTNNVTIATTIITPPTGFPVLDNLTPCMLIGLLPGHTNTSNPSDRTGYQVSLSWNSDKTALVAPFDLTNYTGKIIIGYRYNYLVELPRFYFKQDTSDYTASLTIARVKTALGFSGTCNLEVYSGAYNNWNATFDANPSNVIQANSSPVSEASIHTLPIHRRTQDFFFRINSDSPYPLSLDSVTWEGNYTPRYYRRF